MEEINKVWIFSIVLLLIVSLIGIAVKFNLQKDIEVLNKDNEALLRQNELLQTETLNQLDQFVYLKGIISYKDSLLVELEPKVQECKQDNTAILELFNKCTFLDPNKQYIAFDIGVNVTALLNPKCPHKSSTNTIYETTYIIEQVPCGECPLLTRCPFGKILECTGTDICGCVTGCSCIIVIR